SGGGEVADATVVDPATAILGPDDAPAGFTWVDTSGNQADPAAVQQMNQIFDQFSFDSPACQEQFNQKRQLLGTGQSGPTSTYAKDADPQNSLVALSAGTAPTGDPYACDGTKASMADVGINMSMKTTALDLTLNGVDNLVATRVDTTVSAQGQTETSSQMRISGQVNGTWFTAESTGDVDQAVVQGLAQAQADRLRG
ncbi:hypothetical protein, partial [uncultured Corynebacterium sp.]|uniref:hypothetical protein n=1 Tax=uncultured Corynebacterium sp. TaxID=159447 RepID=UPI0025D46CEE